MSRHPTDLFHQRIGKEQGPLLCPSTTAHKYRRTEKVREKQDHDWNSPNVLATRAGWLYKQKDFSSPEVEQEREDFSGLPGHLVGLLHFEAWFLEAIWLKGCGSLQCRVLLKCNTEPWKKILTHSSFELPNVPRIPGSSSLPCCQPF